jgi:serine/threonine protein kinase
MHRREFSQGQLVAMMRQVAVGMKYLVDQGFVHRDLSAQNIACNAQLHCKIADFSLARKITESQFAPPVC